MNIPGLSGRKFSSFFLKRSKTSMEHVTEEDHIFCCAYHFHRMLQIERKRTERSKKPFLLMLLDLSGLQNRQQNDHVYEKIKSTFVSCSRETDIRGWYEHNKVMGIIFTEVASVDENSIERIVQKLRKEISKTLDAGEIKGIKVSFDVFPEENRDSAFNNGLFNRDLYPDLSKPCLPR